MIDCASLLGGRDERLGSHEEQEHDEGAGQVGVEHFISHLGELDQTAAVRRSEETFRLLVPVTSTQFIPAYLLLDVRVLEDQRQRSDVLLVHALAASNLDGVLDAFVDLFGGGLPDVGQ